MKLLVKLKALIHDISVQKILMDRNNPKNKIFKCRQNDVSLHSHQFSILNLIFADNYQWLGPRP